jgi:hypothetical protein
MTVCTCYPFVACSLFQNNYWNFIYRKKIRSKMSWQKKILVCSIFGCRSNGCLKSNQSRETRNANCRFIDAANTSQTITKEIIANHQSFFTQTIKFFRNCWKHKNKTHKMHFSQSGGKCFSVSEAIYLEFFFLSKEKN